MPDRSFMECWSLDPDDAGFVEGFSPGGRIWAAFQLRFFRTHGRFPSREDDPCLYAASGRLGPCTEFRVPFHHREAYLPRNGDKPRSEMLPDLPKAGVAAERHQAMRQARDVTKPIIQTGSG